MNTVNAREHDDFLLDRGNVAMPAADGLIPIERHDAIRTIDGALALVCRELEPGNSGKGPRLNPAERVMLAQLLVERLDRYGVRWYRRP